MAVESSNYKITDSNGETLIEVTPSKVTIPEEKEDEVFMQRPVNIFKDGKKASKDKSVYTPEEKKSIETTDSKGLDFVAMDGNLLLDVKTKAKKAEFEISEEDETNYVIIPLASGETFEVTMTDLGIDSGIKSVTVTGKGKPGGSEAEIGFSEGEIKTSGVTGVKVSKDDGTLKDAYTVSLKFNGHGLKADYDTVVEKNMAFKDVVADPFDYGWKFEGWYTNKDKTDDSKFDTSSKLTSDTTLYADWSTVEEPEAYFAVDKEHGTDFVTTGIDSTGKGRYEHAYTGSKITPSVVVTANGKILEAGKDYTVKYANNINIDTKKGKPATVTITGKGEYKKYKDSLEFYVTPMDLSDGTESGNPAKGVVVGGVVIASGAKVTPMVTVDGKKLAAKDYDVTSSTGNLKIKEGDNATLTITGKGNYTGAIRNIPVVIKDKKIASKAGVAVTLKSKLSYTYNGNAHYPSVTTDLNDPKNIRDITVKDKSGKLLVADKDFVMNVSSNVNAGTMKITIIGTGEHNGYVTKTVKILPDKTLTKDNVRQSGKTVIVDAKNGSKPDLIIEDSRGRKLVEGVDYKLTCKNNKKAGDAKYTVNFIGNYKGSKAVSDMFHISTVIEDE